MDNEQEPTQVMPDHPEYIAMAAEAKRFKSSAFGSYLLDMAAKEAGEAAQALCVVNPKDTEEIIKLQNDTRRLRDLNKWINQAIQIGNAEYSEYQRKLGGDE